MGRELKRVALDFDWPLHKVWHGYLNPYYNADKCPLCEGTGYSKQAKYLYDQWYGYVEFDPYSTGSRPLTPNTPIVREYAERQVQRAPEYYGVGEWAIVQEATRLARIWNESWSHHLDQEDIKALWKEGRLADFNPTWRENHNEGVEPPLAADVNYWSLVGMGHDGINSWICVRAKCERLGYPAECHLCNGEGELWASEEAKALYENWEKVEPPTGEGWQVWETVSEGSPISPVFATKDELINWLIGEGYSEGAAERFAEVGFAMSAMIVNGVFYNNIEALSAAHGNEE